jgi:preprotein translocase subunit SecD
MNDQRNNIFIVAIVALTIAAIIVVWPQNPANYVPSAIANYLPHSEGIHLDWADFHRQGFRLGLDLQGGTHMVLRADISNVPVGTSPGEAVDGVAKVIEKRINTYGVSESIVQRRGSDRIIVELPGVKNIEEAKNLIGKTAQLDFREQKTVDGKQEWVIATAPGNDGVEKELTGRYFKKAEVGFERTGKPMILFEFDNEGAKMFSEITKRLLNKPLGIYLDGQEISRPTVQSQISGQGQITGTFTLDEAKNLVIQLNAGALPLPVNIEEERTVDATLGADSVHKSVVAGQIALLIVAVFMIGYYRMLGVVAVAALFVYTLLLLAIFKLWPVTLTLAGIAGFILSIGMAVDANVLIFERMKEELRLGKSMRAAIDAGFGRAWTSIRDANVAALLTCAVLAWFGSNFGASIITGFAVTLAIGIGTSMFSAVVVTRAFLRAVMGSRASVNPKLFGLPEPRQAQQPLRPAELGV